MKRSTSTSIAILPALQLLCVAAALFWLHVNGAYL
jgi:hypothetical protein